MRHTSKQGVAFIAGWEGFSSVPYNDAANNATIGYGHLLHSGPVSAADRQKWGTITRDRARDLLAGDLLNAERCVLENVKPPFAFQWRFDALVSFVFNVGCGAFERSTLLRLLNAGRLRKGAADELLKWDYAGGQQLPGLLARRKAERALFLHRRYG